MTNEEEAITIIKKEFSEYKDTLSVYAKKRKKAFDMAIKALEQQPCEDCISRQEALNEINKKVLCYTYEARKIIENLPSVTPQPKRGKWISIDATHSKCEKCEAIFQITSPNAEVNFCPSCGVLLESEMQI